MVDNHEREWTEGESRVPLTPGQPLELIISQQDGEVSIRATARDDVLIRCESLREAEADDSDRPPPRVDVAGNRIVIRAAEDGWSRFATHFGWLGHGRRDRSHGEIIGEIIGSLFACDGYDEIVVEVPDHLTDTRLEVHTASGDLEVRDLVGTLKLATASGDLRVRGARGDLTANTASGDLSIEGLAGRVSAHTASGDARVTAARLDSFTLRTASGDCNVETTLTGDGPFSLESVSGDLYLDLGAEASDAASAPTTFLSFQSLSGDAYVKPPFRQVQRHTWRAGSGETGRRITAKSVSGELYAKLTLRSASPRAAGETPQPPPPVPPVPSVPPVPPMPPAAWEPTVPVDATAEAAIVPDIVPPVGEELAAASDHDHRLAVLEAVERGEIDVEEALRRLGGDPTGRPAEP